MPDTSLAIQKNLTILIATPSRLAELTKGLSAAQLVTAPAPDEWSARDVLAHLRACADVWGKYMALILHEDRPAFRAVSPRTWIRKTDYLGLPFDSSLRAFSAQRAQLLRVLKPLPARDWARSATVTGVGKPLHRTVLDYVIRMAVHERVHLQQVERIAHALRR